MDTYSSVVEHVSIRRDLHAMGIGDSSDESTPPPNNRQTPLDAFARLPRRGTDGPRTPGTVGRVSESGGLCRGIVSRLTCNRGEILCNCPPMTARPRPATSSTTTATAPSAPTKRRYSKHPPVSNFTEQD
jgi:hypothetical protein